MHTFEEIREVICEQWGVSPQEVRPETLFMEDLGADSLDLVELVMALEEKFIVEIPDENAAELLSVNDVVRYIESKVSRLSPDSQMPPLLR